MNEKELFKMKYVKNTISTVLAVLIVCTMINVAADIEFKREIEKVRYQQEDTLNMIMTHRQKVEGLPIEETKEELISLGEFRITHYCSCEKCCGKTDGITYTGTQATAGRTIGVDPEVIPLGSTVYIDGQAYIAEDTGSGINGKMIDMFVDSHQEAIEKGVHKSEVYIYEFK